MSKKIIFGFLTVVFFIFSPLVAVYLPELLIIIDFGGIELVIGFLFLYYKPLIKRIKYFIKTLKMIIHIFHSNIINSMLVKSHYLISHQIVSLFILFLTGSTVLSLGVFFPVIYIGGI